MLTHNRLFKAQVYQYDNADNIYSSLTVNSSLQKKMQTAVSGVKNAQINLIDARYDTIRYDRRV